MNPYQFPFLTPTPSPIDSSHEVLNRILDVVTNIDNRLTNIENRLEDLESRLPNRSNRSRNNYPNHCSNNSSRRDLYNSMLGEVATHRKTIETAYNGLKKNSKKFSHIPQPIRNREISKFETNIKRMYKVPIDQCEKHWVGKYFIYSLFKSYNRSSSKGNERGDVSSMTTRDDASLMGATRLTTGFPDKQTTCQPESSLAISFSQPSTQHQQLTIPSSPSNSSHATSFSIPSSLTPSSSTPSSSTRSSSAPSTGSQATRKRKASQQAFPVSVRARNQSDNQ
ncbi:hypothetical protein INT45_011162 [Circinella minor]|uniref:Uncharacterized protein n=1 Tax=Circinella minor TaxID=1195481 RepID=A0A8H7RR07_9FUNG|nr:hypothetical protein INT45_011162 [Circinella minor]